MKTPIKDLNLIQHPPHSPRERFGGYAILGRTVDKCRAGIAGNLGEYHFDCPLDNKLFGFKGINGAQFKGFVATAKNYEDVAQWLQSVGTRKSPEEIKAWSDLVEQTSLKETFAKADKETQKNVAESCQKMGLDFETTPLFDWLEADDRASFELHPEMAQH